MNRNQIDFDRKLTKIQRLFSLRLETKRFWSSVEIKQIVISSSWSSSCHFEHFVDWFSWNQKNDLGRSFLICWQCRNWLKQSLISDVRELISTSAFFDRNWVSSWFVWQKMTINSTFWSLFVGVNTNTSKREQEKRKRRKRRRSAKAWKKAITTTTTFCQFALVQTMFLTKQPFSYFLFFFFFFIISAIDGCNIWKASDCPQPPTADDEEIVSDFTFDLKFQKKNLFSLNTIFTHVNNFFNFVIKEKNTQNVSTNDFNVVI